MNTKIKLITLCATLASASGALAQVNTYPAQNSSDPFHNNPELMRRYFPHLMGEAEPQNAKSKPAPEPTFDIEFPGGQPHVLLDHLEIELGKDKPNIMISPGMTAYEIPAFKLRQVTVADLFQALNSLSNNQARWELSGSQKPIWILKPAESNPFGGGFGGLMGGATGPAFQPRLQNQASIHENQARIAQNAAERQARTINPLTGQPIFLEQPKLTRVFPLANHLENYRIEDITTAIQTAWEMMPDNGPGELKFHEDTQLLIAVGSRDKLILIEEILASLQPPRGGVGGIMVPPPPHATTPLPSRPPRPTAPLKPADTLPAPGQPAEAEPEPAPDNKAAPHAGELNQGPFAMV